jgi:hypothetical protein
MILRMALAQLLQKLRYLHCTGPCMGNLEVLDLKSPALLSKKMAEIGTHLTRSEISQLFRIMMISTQYFKDQEVKTSQKTLTWKAHRIHILFLNDF